MDGEHGEDGMDGNAEDDDGNRQRRRRERQRARRREELLHQKEANQSLVCFLLCYYFLKFCYKTPIHVLDFGVAEEIRQAADSLDCPM
jgi:hypothetical protein